MLSRLGKRRSYAFVAIDRATRFVFVQMLYRRDAQGISGCLKDFIAAFPHPAYTILTDNDGAFTDRFTVSKKGNPVVAIFLTCSARLTASGIA